MNLRTRITLLFIIIVGLIITLASIAIYFFSADYREDDFYNRLSSKGTNTAKLLIEVEEVDVDLLRRIDRDNPIRLPREIISIYNYRNDLLYSTDDNNVFNTSSDLLDRIRLQGTIRYTHDDFEVLGFLYSDEFDRFVVLIGAMDIYGKGKLKNLRFVLMSVLGISILVVSLSAWIFAGRVLRPISKVIDRVNEISITSLDKRVEEGRNRDELNKLARTFNEMLDRLEGAFLIQKNFIANASHELRTPLTAVTGQLEVLLLNPRTQEEYQAATKSVLEDIKSLNSLANRLLLLAQASSENAAAKSQPQRIDELIWQVRDEVIKRHPNYEILIQLDTSIDDEAKLIVLGDEHLLKTAISNLIDNGCKFSPNHTVEVTLSADQEFLTLSFADRGIGIEPEDLPLIFEPFHRGKNTAKVKGHGIGLSLVDSIVRSHGGEVKVDSHPQKGTTFQIQFRLSA